jgi:hypothetical protein
VRRLRAQLSTRENMFKTECNLGIDSNTSRADKSQRATCSMTHVYKHTLIYFF